MRADDPFMPPDARTNRMRDDQDYDDDEPYRRRRRSDIVHRGGGTLALVLGLVALFLGVAALILCWVPVLRWVALVVAVLGLVIGIIGTVIGIMQKGANPALPLAGSGANLLALFATIVLFVVSAVGSDFGETLPGETVAGWGQTFDPDGDCTITPQGQALTISVPATAHDLSAELGQVNAPRVLQAVEGDFTAQVKVCGAIHPTAGAAIPGRLPFQSGGLLVWSDGRNYARLERQAINRNGLVLSSAGFELRANGQISPGAQTSTLPEQDTYLRVQRRGNQLLGAVSSDGHRWTDLRPITVTFPTKVQVGVAAVNAAQEPLTVRYEEFQLGR